jgi:transposase
MYIEISRKITKTKIYEYILLRKSIRDKKTGKINKVTLANLSNEPIEQVMTIVNAFKGKITISPEDLGQGKTIGFSLVIIFIMNMLGILKAIGKTYEAKIAIVLIVARITIQSSRLQALKWAKNRDHILDIVEFSKKDKDKLNDKNIYLGLDYIEQNQEKIEDKLFKSYYGDNLPKRLFYDVTSSYVQGDYKNSELVAYGYNRDGKKGTAQIVIGLLTDENGHAVSIHTYPGNTNDVATFTDQLDKLKNRFNLENITIVGDGGMIKSNDIIKIKELGYDYITTIGKPSIKKLIDDKDSQIQLSLFDEDLQEVVENNTRYIVRRNPTRMAEIRETRESKIQRLEEFVDIKKDYYNTHYRAKQETLKKNINKKISNLKLSKFVSCDIYYNDGDIIVKDKNGNNETKIKALATTKIIIDEKSKQEVEQLDGCYVVTTSLLDKDKHTKEDIHQAYKTLIKVENAFKTLKTEFLEIRPLYLKTDKRIKGHVALSMIAYNITLKLKSYTNIAKLDFKDTIGILSEVKTTSANLTKKISMNYIPQVSQNLQNLFKIMNFTLPRKVNY